ncbi:hypothetical protein M9458_003282, partial [Cirrhinus mrigala]
CEVKTCWWSQPDFRVIGDYMKDKYDSASEMVVEKHRESRGWYTFFKPPTETDLVYYESSPNFCEPNPETGSFGTRDRICNLTSHGIDGCDLLCCGRGHNTRTEKRKEKCHCIFHWSVREFMMSTRASKKPPSQNQIGPDIWGCEHVRAFCPKLVD